MPSDESWKERKKWQRVATSSGYVATTAASSEILVASTDYETKLVKLEIGAFEENWFSVQEGGSDVFGPLRHKSDGQQSYEETFEDPIAEAGAQSSLTVVNTEAIASGVGVSMRLYERRGPE